MRAVLSLLAMAALGLPATPGVSAGGMFASFCSGDGAVRYVPLPARDNSPDHDPCAKACHLACCNRRDERDDEDE